MNPAVLDQNNINRTPTQPLASSVPATSSPLVPSAPPIDINFVAGQIHRTKHANSSAQTGGGSENNYNNTAGSAMSMELTEQQLRLIEEQTDKEKELLLTGEDKLKRLDHRSKIKGEILSTESSYVSSLDILHNCFIIPLRVRSSSQKSFISIEHTESLLSNLETLIKFHHSFLTELTAAATATAAANSNISLPAVFIRFSDFFAMYTLYLQNYEKMLNSFQSLKSNKKFQEFLGECRAKIQSSNNNNNNNQLDLMSYLIMPVQRVPRYVLLLQELKRFTDYSHIEYNSLLDALSKIKKVALKINEGKREIENMQKLLEISESISGDLPISLIEPHRRLIKNGILILTTASGLFGTMKSNNRIMYLFSDILLWTSEDHRYKGMMDLAAAQLDKKPATTTNSSSNNNNSNNNIPTVKLEFKFELSTSKQAVIFECKTADELFTWLNELESVMSVQQVERNRAAQRKRVQKSRARKTDNTAAESVHSKITESLMSMGANRSALAAAGNENQDFESESQLFDQAKFDQFDSNHSNTATATATATETQSPQQHPQQSRSTSSTVGSKSPTVGSPPQSAPISSNNNNSMPTPGSAPTKVASAVLLAGKPGTDPLRIEFNGKFKPKIIERRGRQAKPDGEDHSVDDDTRPRK